MKRPVTPWGFLVLLLFLLAGCGAQPTVSRLLPSAPTLSKPKPATIRYTRPPVMLDAVGFASRTVGWVGGNGTILATTDGGRHWQVQYQGNGRIVFIQALNSAHAFALGHRSLLGTADGGRHWVKLGEPHWPLGSIDFVTPTLGYGLASPRSGFGGTLFRTGDGGHTWTPVGTGFAAASACFTSATDGWAVAGGGVMQTENGGGSWRTSLNVVTPAEGMGGRARGTMACTGPGNVWVLIDGGAGMNQESYTFYHTSDGGTHWRVVAANSTAGGGPAPGNLVGAPRGTGAYPGPLAAVNGRVAYLLGVCGPCGALGNATMGGTRDGGASWTDYPGTVPTLSGNGQMAVSFPTENHGWIAATPLPGEAEILTTTDGGHTWQVQYVERTTKPVGPISFVTGSLGYGLGTPGDPFAVLKTTDGGIHWGRAGRLPGPPAPPNPGSLSFASARIGFAVTPSGILFETRDGGQRWQKVPTAQPENANGQVFFANRQDGCLWRNGPLGTPPYLGTTNGGHTWRAVPGATGGTIGCALGLSRPTWRAPIQQIGYLPHLPWEIWSLAAAHGADWWAAGTGNRHAILIHSRNAGNSWTKYSFPFSSYPNAQFYSFANAHDGWMSTGNGRLFHTTDGGAHWVQVP